ncbi:MAG: HEAT repeat domain-containing protein [Alkalicoccus sp.]|nr:MAG: HEAT repeat domain-containing protein [Alkalicoccus sp.]
MVWAWWLIGIFLVLQLTLLGVLLIGKYQSLRFEEKVEHSFTKLMPVIKEYVSGSVEEVKGLPKNPHLRREMLEKVLSKIRSETKGMIEAERIRQLAVKELQPQYEKMLSGGDWADRMNAMYFMEEFLLDDMGDTLAARVRHGIKNGEEYRQAMRVLASFSHLQAVESLFDEKNKSVTFIKEVMRRLNREKLTLLYYRTGRQDLLLLQAFLVHVGERGEEVFLPYVEKALKHEELEIRLKALKSLCFYKQVKQPELIEPFFQSEFWEERMYACKTAAAVSGTQWKESLLHLLGDSAWWVRSAAAEALLSFSDGPELLEESRQNHKDRYARDMAAKMLTTRGEVSAHDG